MRNRTGAKNPNEPGAVFTCRRLDLILTQGQEENKGA